ncbi:hypothetical protein DMJ13_07075 [halophilic archaeon]|nr:hypothetical protein DMJ13_07075 [halophilic archaeon]
MRSARGTSDEVGPGHFAGGRSALVFARENVQNRENTNEDGVRNASTGTLGERETGSFRAGDGECEVTKRGRKAATDRLERVFRERW